ncbi:hypothetical protein [Jiella marina]|uniref:hypothetical protein n=1 Tax=Jiella sp. LLJ827 TaxID=2917712 RepID=UPI002100DB36|nr:hypothetical protein [Jiella sp. LLJ827]MCQ0990546.1 hypothetical protein [Jiella sp. LLJ827]
MSSSSITLPRILANLVAIIAVILGSAFVLDVIWAWFGQPPFALCGLLPIVDLVLGRTIGTIFIYAGLIAWGFSLFQNASYLLLALSGVVLSGIPGMITAALGVSCSMPLP